MQPLQATFVFMSLPVFFLMPVIPACSIVVVVVLLARMAWLSVQVTEFVNHILAAHRQVLPLEDGVIDRFMVEVHGH